MMSSLNESDKSTHLELLPVELQCRILTSIPNMKALRALLGASPRYFQAYRTCRGMVLSHVAWNHITPAVVPIALDTLEQRDNRKAQKTPKGPCDIPLETWERLLRFHQIVDSFISDFTSSRLVALENSIHPQTQTFLPHESLNRHLSLSQLEYARLARAFYHLELYSAQIIQMTSPFQAKQFLQSLQDWELEELLCVRSYLMERLIEFLNKFEDDFMKAYLKDKPRIIWWSYKCGLNWRLYLFIGGHNFKDYWMESCLVRGLESLSAIFSADKLPNRFNALEHIELSYLWISTALIGMQSYSGEKETAKMKESSEIGYYDNFEQPNEAWFWAIKFCGPPGSRTRKGGFKRLDGCDTNDFERWGYVIWDHARLERLGILTKSPSDISATIGTDWLIKRTPNSLEARTREQEEIWLQEGLQSTLTEPRPVFEWDDIWFE